MKSSPFVIFCYLFFLLLPVAGLQADDCPWPCFEQKSRSDRTIQIQGSARKTSRSRSDRKKTPNEIALEQHNTVLTAGEFRKADFEDVYKLRPVFKESITLWKKEFEIDDCKAAENDCGRHIPPRALKAFLQSVHRHGRRTKLHQYNYFFVFDLEQHSSKLRGYLVHRPSGRVERRYLTSHALQSDRDRDGFADDFSNVSKTDKTSIGLFEMGISAPSSFGAIHGKMHGLNNETNSNAFNRTIVLHGHKLAHGGTVNKFGKLIYSKGCPMVRLDLVTELVEKLRGRRHASGSLFYIHGTDKYPGN